jgi:hypothetical protein
LRGLPVTIASLNFFFRDEKNEWLRSALSLSLRPFWAGVP